MSATIQHSLPIAVTLTAEQWEMVARVLSNGPYNVVAPLISSIQQQCMRHAEPLPEHMPMRVPGGMARPNGIDEDARE
jgi:hypothetical protein